jgi:hypothetical protein
MKKIISRLTFLLLISLCMGACKTYEVQFEGLYDDNKSADTKTISYQIVYVQSGKLYMTDPTLTNVKSFPSLPSGITTAMVSPNFDKIAYKIGNGNISIFDIAGNSILTLDGTSTATSFDWHENNQTLYYIDNTYNMRFYGPSVKAALTNFNTIFPAFSVEKRLYPVVLLGDGTVIYARSYHDGWNYNRKLVRKPISGSETSQSFLMTVWDISWLTAVKDNSAIYLGGLGSFNQRETYFMYLGSSNSAEQISNIRLMAYAPDGASVVKLTDTRLYLDGRNNFSKTLDGTKITSLDW